MKVDYEQAQILLITHQQRMIIKGTVHRREGAHSADCLCLAYIKSPND